MHALDLISRHTNAFLQILHTNLVFLALQIIHRPLPCTPFVLLLEALDSMQSGKYSGGRMGSHLAVLD